MAGPCGSEGEGLKEGQLSLGRHHKGEVKGSAIVQVRQRGHLEYQQNFGFRETGQTH
jgi:hypothetical protein